MSSSLPFAINHLQHTGIPVTSIERSQKFYESLGFQVVMEAPFHLPEGSGNCIMMKHETVLIELYQLPEALKASISSRHDGHIDHIAFDVDDVDLAFESLTNAGYHIIEPSPVTLKFWEKGCRYFNITGPDGERLEFNQVL